LKQKFKKSGNNNYKNLGTKITKIKKIKLQKSRNKNIKRNKSYKNPGTKVTKRRNNALASIDGITTIKEKNQNS
jgi:hypothetical protein